MKSTLTLVQPVQGVPDGAGSNDPSIREAWLEQRRGGITATEIRDWGTASKRRDIIAGKVTGVEADRDVRVRSTGFSLDDYATHGRVREPIIAEWIQRRFGIVPCSHVFAHGEHPRHLASPDGVSREPFSGELIVGADASLAEIKTSTKNLMPGRISPMRVLLEIDESSEFARKGYYSQMQWQMWVMNAARTLFVWEQHDGKVDPDLGTFSPIGTPEYVWVPRNEAHIAALVQRAERALAEIDAARVSMTSDQVPVTAEGLDAERAQLVSDYLAAVDAESAAAKAKKAAWEALQAHYLGEDKPDVTIKVPGFASVTVSTSETLATVVDEDAMRKRAPKMVEQYEKLRERYTKKVPRTSRRLTIRAQK